MYQFGYELKSKQVRRYKVNCLQSVRKGIAANIQDYLEYQGVSEAQFSFSSMVPAFVILCIGAVIFLQWLLRAPDSRVQCSIVVFFIAFLFSKIWEKKFALNDVVFEGKGKVEVNENSKPFIKALAEVKGKIRIYLSYTESCNAMSLKVQIVDDSFFPAHSKVRCGVEKRILFSEYFNFQGFFFPPAMIADLDALMNRLLNRYLQ